MAQYTFLNDADLQSILTHYSVGKVLSYKVLSGGSENTNYLVKTQTDAFVLTICEQKSQKEAKNLASLLVYLQLNNFTTSKLQKAKNDALIVIWNDKAIILKAFIQGDIIENLSENLLVNLGVELEKLHQIKAPDYLPHIVWSGVERFDEVQVYAPNSSFYNWLKTMQIYIENHINTDLPKSLIHSDVFYDNVIVNENKDRVTIMDFEEASYYYRVFDIGMMIIGTCRSGKTINLDKVKSLLRGYQQKTKLLDVEKKAVKAFTIYAATAVAFWRHQNFNYVNVIPEKKEHYLEMKLLADTIMNLSDQQFLL